MCCILLWGAQATALWTLHSIDNEGRGADGVVLSDVNGDGNRDIVCGWEEAGETRAYVHPGPSKAADKWPKVVVGKTGAVEGAFFADIDNDGAVDVISLSENMNMYVNWAPRSKDDYLKAGAWKTDALPAASGMQKWMIGAALQLDGKNGIDIVAAGKGTEVVWFEAPANPRDLGSWKRHTIFSKGGWTMGLMLVDMDGDGDKDVLLSVRRTNPGVIWLENPGLSQSASRWTAHTVGVQGSVEMGFLDYGDINQDGRGDIVCGGMTSAKVYLHLGRNASGTGWQTVTIASPYSERNKGVAFGDINQDGHIDIALIQEFAEACWMSHGGDVEKTQWAVTRIGKGGKFDDATLHDIDSDGDLDILTTDERGQQVIWFENPLEKHLPTGIRCQAPGNRREHPQPSSIVGHMDCFDLQGRYLVRNSGDIAQWIPRISAPAGMRNSNFTIQKSKQ